MKKGKPRTGDDGGCGCPHLPSLDDLRYYAYEGDGSSPASLSSCCSGADSVDEAKLIGGFQDVATLLNCLTGQSAAQSPARRHPKQHKHEEPCPTLTPFNISSNKADSTLTSPSKITKEGSDEGHTVPVITDYDTKMHASLIHRKCNSLPRARAPKIFVNNLHNFTTSPDRASNALVKSDTTSTHAQDHTTEGCHSEHKYLKSLLAPPSSSREMPPAQAGIVCLACRAATHTGHNCQHGGAPRRSKSFSTVSYIASPGGGCPCPISCSPPGALCSANASKLKSCTVPDHHNTAISSRCSYTTNTAPVVFSKNNKNYNSGELFLL